jgi:hypothetical protein
VLPAHASPEHTAPISKNGARLTGTRNIVRLISIHSLPRKTPVMTHEQRARSNKRSARRDESELIEVRDLGNANRSSISILPKALS